MFGRAQNADGSPSGAVKITLKEGLFDGKASMQVKAKGTKVALPDLAALTGPIDVQLQRSGGAPCFGTTFGTPFLKQDATAFKDKAD